MTIFNALRLITPPALEPVSLADARLHTRISTTLEDSLLAGYIAAARTHIEQWLQRALLPQTWAYSLNNFPGRDYTNQRNLGMDEYYRSNFIEIPNPPLTSILSFSYRGSDGTQYEMLQTGYGNGVGNYLTDFESEPGRIVLPFSGLWPTTILSPSNPIRIVYTCGYPLHTGTCDVSITGLVTLKTGSALNLIPAGSWMTINGQSYDVLSITDSTHLQISSSVPITEAKDAAFTANSVPMPIRTAILLLAAYLYDNRESAIASENRPTYVELPQMKRFLAGYESRSVRR